MQRPAHGRALRSYSCWQKLDKPVIILRFRGREMAHTEIGRDLLNKFAELCTEVSTLDKAAKLEGRNMSIFLSPKAGK